MEVYQIISLIVLIVIIIYSAVLSVIYYVRSYKSKKIDASNKSGKEIVSSILDKYNLKNINIEKIDGSDRYFYIEDTIFLSKDIYEGRSIYDVAVSGYIVSSFIKNNESKHLIKILSNLFNSSLDLNDNLTIADKITYMEIFIDKFIYENKDLIDKLKEQLDLIANSEIENTVVQINVIDNLKKIKMYYNIFNKYGRNKLTKEDFEDLYQIIFNFKSLLRCF